MNKTTLPLPVALPTDVSADEARLFLAIKLYEVGKVSLGKAAEIAGYSKRAFIEVAGKSGVDIIQYSVEDLEKELAR